MTGRPTLVLGPLLRHVGTTGATVWVETDRPCAVEVNGVAQPTWTVHGHHYCLVVLDGLEPGSHAPYEVRLDGELVWPEPGSDYPPSRISTIDPGTPTRLLFGSCRYARPEAVAGDPKFEPDALDTYAHRMLRSDPETWPDAVLLLGDQVYADETTAETQARIAERRSLEVAPYEQVKDYEEYTWLYSESWTDPDIRWLLSTLPTAMIFDDHDVRDDWNTSEAWREDMQATTWWQERIVGGLASYWVYQHLGNLSPRELESDVLYQRVLAHDGDCGEMLDEFARAADAEADGRKGAQWSFRRDFSNSVLLMIDSRCGRILADDRRSMVSEDEFAWIVEQAEGSYDHLLIGTSLPWLLPRSFHDVESWNEMLTRGARGPRMARFAEWFRRAADLEHWAAFRDSFDALGELIARVGRGEHGGDAPATICVLSGDVHHAYVAEAHFDAPVRSSVYQLTCSPVHNYVPRAFQLGFRVAWSRAAARLTRFLLERVTKVPDQPLTWTREAGPFWGNEIATLVLDGRSAHVEIERAGRDDHGTPELTQVVSLRLS
ncbi:alkaline phosphatase D family protein [Ilumatobacter sp.]|uniref:alkaline phosphatase D family protein n=1 Tax=Ilumatobacter sp. TaxID=1967498 RepID=UPI003B51D226